MNNCVAGYTGIFADGTHILKPNQLIKFEWIVFMEWKQLHGRFVAFVKINLFHTLLWT